MSHPAYLDSSALVKLVVLEAESRALALYVRDVSAVYTSALSEVEVPRGVRSAGGTGLPERSTRTLLDRCEIVDCHAEVRRVAADFEPAGLRSLDAVHLASALRVQHLIDAFVTYDRRLAAAARDAGLPVVAPGQA